MSVEPVVDHVVVYCDGCGETLMPPGDVIHFPAVEVVKAAADHDWIVGADGTACCDACRGPLPGGPDDE